MNLSVLFRTWWVILIQGILMIVLSFMIFRNPNAVLSTLAFYIGMIVIITGLVGVIAHFSNAKAERDTTTLVGSAVILIIGILMISKIVVTIKAITLVFGLLAAIVGLALIVGSWSGRKQWSLWWIIALLGLGALSTGVKSIMSISSGAESISNLIGISVFFAGLGLIFLAFLKKKVISGLKTKLQDFAGNRS